MDVDKLFASYGPKLSPAERAQYDADFARGVALERSRIAAIFALPEAEHRYVQAKALALSDEEVSPELAAKLLAASPVLARPGASHSALDLSFADRVPKSTAEAFAHGQKVAALYGLPPRGSATTPDPEPLPPLSTKPVSAMTQEEAFAHGQQLAQRFGQH